MPRLSNTISSESNWNSWLKWRVDARLPRWSALGGDGPISAAVWTDGSHMSATGIDEAKLEAFMGRAVTDMGAIISAPLMVIGEKLGLYKAMAGAGPLSSQEVAGVWRG